MNSKQRRKQQSTATRQGPNRKQRRKQAVERRQGMRTTGEERGRALVAEVTKAMRRLGFKPEEAPHALGALMASSAQVAMAMSLGTDEFGHYAQHHYEELLKAASKSKGVRQ